ncbi:hypothetical protein QAD02_012500 [Eretmocerus hayati]|uniref:Uncharacterized protein n=1 Tax=Eretmocerus hayati TaxID=131215 RepID=A0ACC2P0R3_9HYME|nr:hypothetical protein QAD02_012500 [Eretmocerus hayati]
MNYGTHGSHLVGTGLSRGGPGLPKISADLNETHILHESEIRIDAWERVTETDEYYIPAETPANDYKKKRLSRGRHAAVTGLSRDSKVLMGPNNTLIRYESGFHIGACETAGIMHIYIPAPTASTRETMNYDRDSCHRVGTGLSRGGPGLSRILADPNVTHIHHR